MKPTHGYSICITGELIEKWLSLEDGGKIIKIVLSNSPTYSFDFLISSDKGYDIAEGANFPRIEIKKE